MTKMCSKCKEEKPLVEFYKDKSKNDGVTAYCKVCCKDKSARKREDYPEYRKEYIKTHATDIKETRKKYNKATFNHRKDYKVQYNKENKLIINKKRNEQINQRMATDPLYKLTHNIGCLIRLYIKNGGFKKSTKTAQILGCSFEEFKQHIENQFQEGMSWDNYPEWEYDHIYPVSLAESEEHLIQLNHYTNFQPLWAEDNRRKGAKLPEELNINSINIHQEDFKNGTS